MVWKQAMTVNGAVDGGQLGTVYVHEHLLVKPQSDDPKYEDYTLDSVEKSTREARSFRRVGGGTLVEMSPIYFGRDVRGCQQISREAGIHVICATGFHKKEFMPPWFSQRSHEELRQLLRTELLEGMDGTNIRGGVIKLGTSLNNIFPEEERAIRLVAEAHLETGAPISTHCDKGTMGLEQTQLLQGLGVDLSRVLLCHIDSALDVDYALRLCKTGVNICFDHVGRELADGDQFRVEMIAALVKAGYVGQLTLAGDMGKKNYLPAYGGRPGFTYLLTDLKEHLLQKISPEDFYQIMVLNPKQIFAGE